MPISSRHLCCIYDYHQVDTSAVFMHKYSQYLSTVCHDYHQVDTSAVFITVIKSDTSAVLMIVINTVEVSSADSHKYSTIT